MAVIMMRWTKEHFLKKVDLKKDEFSSMIAQHFKNKCCCNKDIAHKCNITCTD